MLTDMQQIRIRALELALESASHYKYAGLESQSQQVLKTAKKYEEYLLALA